MAGDGAAPKVASCRRKAEFSKRRFWRDRVERRSAINKSLRMLSMAGLYLRKHNWIQPDGVLARDRYKIVYIRIIWLNHGCCKVLKLIGRGERIRTSDPLVPNQVLYQAEPLPDMSVDPNISSFYACRKPRKQAETRLDRFQPSGCFMAVFPGQEHDLAHCPRGYSPRVAHRRATPQLRECTATNPDPSRSTPPSASRTRRR